MPTIKQEVAAGLLAASIVGGGVSAVASYNISVEIFQSGLNVEQSELEEKQDALKAGLGTVALSLVLGTASFYARRGSAVSEESDSEVVLAEA